VTEIQDVHQAEHQRQPRGHNEDHHFPTPQRRRLRWSVAMNCGEMDAPPMKSLEAGMKRRDFIVGARVVVTSPIGLAISSVPHALAQDKKTIGFLGPTAASAATTRIAAFERRLSERGWTVDQTIRIDYRWADGRTDQFEPLAAELAKRRVAVIATWGTATALAAKHVTSAIPIVFTLVGDPVGSGLVVSLARPGGNITETSTQHQETVGKRIQLLHELLPSMGRLAVLSNVGNPADVEENLQVQKAVKTLGIAFVQIDVRRGEDIVTALSAQVGKADALYVNSDALFANNRKVINELALKEHLPTMHSFREMAEAGGLVSYGPDYLDLFRRAADQVYHILREAKPSDMPAEQPTKFELVLNQKTAKALGINVSASLLTTVDEVIE
jgi:putative ABC transport system substrate-binding protein